MHLQQALLHVCLQATRNVGLCAGTRRSTVPRFARKLRQMVLLRAILFDVLEPLDVGSTEGAFRELERLSAHAGVAGNRARVLRITSRGNLRPGGGNSTFRGSRLELRGLAELGCAPLAHGVPDIPQSTRIRKKNHFKLRLRRLSDGNDDLNLDI